MIKKYTDQELENNYKKFLEIIKKYISGQRKDQLLHMYSMQELGANLMLSPASGNKDYHNAYEGGYIDHVFNVCKNTLKMKNLFVESGGVVDFTDEELVFAALHHDLGKLGIKGELHYIPNDSDWHIKNRGEYYKRNEKIPFMSITDRGFFTLSQYSISLTEKEWFGIKLTDGMYDEDNEKYYKVYDTSKYLRYTIQYILHWADHMSTIIERKNNS
jgi:hypothetical protein